MSNRVRLEITVNIGQTIRVSAIFVFAYRVKTSKHLLMSSVRKSCVGPVFPTIYDFESIQSSDTLMSDGYLNNVLTDECN